jgi:hypothetical protein
VVLEMIQPDSEIGVHGGVSQFGTGAQNAR